MTNHWIDLQNCKTILVEGSNVAENHPMAFKWIRKAQENGAKIIHVDPRYTRTSAAADVSPHAGHWSTSRAVPQSRQRVMQLSIPSACRFRPRLRLRKFAD